MTESKLTKFSALFLALLTLLGTVFSVPVSAATGDKAVITFTYCYDSNGNTIKFHQTAVHDGYTVGYDGMEIFVAYADGKEAYCIQPGHSIYSGDILTEGGSSTWDNLTSAQQKAINLALLCGKPGSGNSLSGTGDEKWAATQLVVWELVSGCRESTNGYKLVDRKFIDGMTAGGYNAGMKANYDTIVNSMQTFETVPSFAQKNTQSANTYSMDSIGGGYSLTLTDYNNVLDKFDFKSGNGVTVTKSGNQLRLVSKTAIKNPLVFGASKSLPTVNTVLVPFGDPGIQDVIVGATNASVNAYFKIITKSGSLKLVKTSEDNNIADIEFTVQGDDYTKTVKTNSNGEFLLSDLKPGVYKITESTSDKYESQPTQTVTVEPDKTATVTFKNTLKKGDLKIIKTSEDGIIADIEFTITGSNGYKRTAKSNDKGEILLSDLVPGSYMVIESIDSRYVGQPPKTVNVEANKTATVSFANILKKGNLKIIKTSEDGIVADIEFVITGPNGYRKIAKSDKNGEILVSDILPGSYMVAENADSRYIGQAPKTVKVEANKTATVEFENILKKGELKIRKVSEDGEVEGIQFIVEGKNYSKTVITNADGELVLPDLVPGNYKVTEVADDRYEEQPAQFVSVVANQETIVTFKNTLKKGNLKIIKTSEDGKIADIEFTVTGTNFKQTVKTNSKGEIVLENLLPGVYTVTESADDRYEPQAPKKVRVQVNKTATVTFKNTIRKSSLKIFKISEDNVVENIEFTVTGANFKQTVKTNADGEIALENLVPGTYTVTESVDERYEPQDFQIVKIEADKTATVTFKNILKKGSLKLVKTSEDGVVADILFIIKGENYRKTAKTNANGEILLSDLVPGTYTVTESVDERYEPQQPKTVKVEADKTATVTFKNILKKGDLKIIKTSEDNVVADIEFTVTGKNFKQTVKTDSKGEIVLENLVPGTYTVTESVDERYEAQQPKAVKVEADKTATVTFKNILKKGNLKIIKTSEDNIVADIEFTVTGKNFKQTVKTDSKGEIVLENLVPGTYTVTEIVDERYEVQQPNTVKVEADKTATVTFKNILKKGDLKIIKTSEDNIVADIEFTVTGKNFKQTVKTDSKGEIVLENLVPGTYTVTESVDERYEAQQPKTVKVEADKTATVTFKNILKKGNLKIIKTSEDNVVADIEFTVTGKDFKQTVKTDSKGEIVLENLVPGTYTVTEIVDERYESQQPKTVKVEADKTATVTFKNVLKKGDLKIIKTSEDNIVADIEFTVTGKNFRQTVKTDSKGEIVLENLVPGTYTVTESVDERYEAQQPKTVKVEVDKTATVTFKNILKKGDLKIVKISENNIVADIEFTVTGKNFKQTAKTDSKGEIVLENLVPGTYTVTESVDERYEAQQPKTVKVEAEKTATVTFKNVLKKGDLKIVKTSEDNIVADIEFTVIGKNFKQTVKTDSKGEIVLENLVPGTYTVTESVDERYEKQEPQKVNVEAEKTTTVTFKNILKKGGLKIIKTSEDNIVADIEFTVTGKNFKQTVKTDSKGEIILENLFPGTYTVTESVDERYESQQPKTVKVEADKTATVTFKNILKKGDLKIIKTSEDNVVEGIEFTVTGKSFKQTVKTDSKGEIILENLVPGTYTVTESVDERYEPQQPKTIKVEADKTATVTFKNILKKGDLKIIKTSEDNIVADIEFTVTGKNFKQTVKTDSKGEIVLENLVPGTYTVTESVDERYEAQQPKTVKVEADKTATVTFKNILKKGNLKIIKISEDNVVADIEFTVTGKNFKQTVKTDSKGEIILENLVPGTYTVTENVDERYEKQEPQKVKVEAEKTAIVTFKNVLKKGSIQVEKIGEVFANVLAIAGSRIDRDGNITVLTTVYQPEYDVQYLNGAVFGVYADEDIVHGSVKIEKDTLVTVLITNNQGIAKSKELYLGRYRILEQKAPYGMTLNREPQFVELTYDGQSETVIFETASFENNRQKVQINLAKIMGIDEKFALGMNNEILNVKFGLFADEDIIATNGNAIPKDGLLEEVKCDENGFAAFKTDLPFGKYYVREIATDEHYILSDKKYPVVFEYENQDTETVNITANDGEKIVNEIIYGSVKGLKINRENKEPVEGALFGLFNIEEKELTEETAILTAVSDKNGIFIFEDVPFGNYLVKEIKPADGFMPNETDYPVTISENEEVVEITAVNDRYPEIKTTATIEGRKEVGATDVFTLEDEVEYKHLIFGKEYTIKGILMDKSTGEPFTEDGREITAEITFTAEESNGFIIVPFTFDASKIKQETDIVVFESLCSDGLELAVHADIEDKEQTVTVKIPEIHTQATADGKKDVTAEKTITITDTVSYRNLTVGKEYTVKGVLMDKTTSKPFMVNGQEITAKVKFTAETADGEIAVNFEFDGLSVTAETEVVVFETLYHNGIELTVHADIDDEDQTVTVKIPEIHTQATADGKKDVTAEKTIAITDTVSYKNLTVSKEYTIKGVLMDKLTGKPFTVNGQEVTAEVKFTAEKASGEIAVNFEFDGLSVTTETDIVVFETLYHNDMALAVHADINDENQTVTVKIPEIHTNANINGKKDVTAEKTITVTDVVKYENLTVGKEYTVKGVLMDKSTGKPFMVKGQEVTAEVIPIDENI